MPAYRVDQMHVHLERRPRPGRGDRGRQAGRNDAACELYSSRGRRWSGARRRHRCTRRSSCRRTRTAAGSSRTFAAAGRSRSFRRRRQAPRCSPPPVRASPASGSPTSPGRLGLNFRQDDFRFGMANDVHSMMGGGLCWLDYNNDGRLDLFVVNSYSDSDTTRWEQRGGLPRSALFENVGGGRFVNVGARSHADPAVQGNGCVAGDFNGDGHTDLFVTTNTYNVLLWNNGDGTFTDGTHAAGIDAFGTFGWHTGAAVADVNGDGRPDIFVSGYADVNAPSDGARRIPDELPGVPRPALPERGPRRKGTFTLPGCVSEGRDRAEVRRSQPRRRLHRRERRRPARPLRRERPRPEPAVRQRAGRPARLPLRRGGRSGGRRRPERRHGRRRPGLLRRRPPRSLRDELARPGPRRVPQATAARRSPNVRSVFAPAVGTRTQPAGATPGSTSRTTAGSTSSSRTARSRSRIWRRTLQRSRSSRT